jgi:hypothetical protein
MLALGLVCSLEESERVQASEKESKASNGVTGEGACIDSFDFTKVQ